MGHTVDASDLDLASQSPVTNAVLVDDLDSAFQLPAGHISEELDLTFSITSIARRLTNGHHLADISVTDGELDDTDEDMPVLQVTIDHGLDDVD